MKRILLVVLLVAILLTACTPDRYQYRIISVGDGTYMAQPCSGHNNPAIVSDTTTRKVAVGDCIVVDAWTHELVGIVDCGICK